MPYLIGQNSYGYYAEEDSDGFSIGDILITRRDLSGLGTFLQCNGQEFDIASYPELAKVLGYTEVSGKGVLPNALDYGFTVSGLQYVETEVTASAASWIYDSNAKQYTQTISISSGYPTQDLSITPIFNSSSGDTNRDIIHEYCKISDAQIDANNRLVLTCFYSSPTTDIKMILSGYNTTGDPTTSTVTAPGSSWIKALYESDIVSRSKTANIVSMSVRKAKAKKN